MYSGRTSHLHKVYVKTILFFRVIPKKHKVLVIWDLNGYGEYEFDWCICDKIMACTIVGVGVRRQRRQRWDIIITTLFCKQIYRYLPLYIYLTFKKKHPIFETPQSNLLHFTPSNHISHILYTNLPPPTLFSHLPPPTFFYPQSPTSHIFLPPISHLPLPVSPPP